MVRPGIYRERVAPLYGGVEGNPIVYKSEVKNGAVIKGSDVWEPEWTELSEGIFGAIPDASLFTDTNYVDGGNPYLVEYSWNRAPYPYKSVSWTLGQVFVDGIQFQEVSSRVELEAGTNCWWYNVGNNRIEIHFADPGPESYTVEITTRRGVFRPVKLGLGYIEVHGFVMEHCGNQFPYRFWDREYIKNVQSGLIGTRGGHHRVIRDNIIRHAKSIGIDIGKVKNDNEIHTFPTVTSTPTGNHQIRNNVIYANGSCGIMGSGHTGVIIANNAIVENNYYKNTTFEDGGIKTHDATNLEVVGNWFVNNETKGCWLDNKWRNCRISRNVFIDNRGYDLFYEFDDNTFLNPSIADNNIFLGGRPGLIAAPEFDGDVADPWQPWSCGVYSHDADGFILAHNLFAKIGYGIYSRDIPGRRGTASYRKIFGNIFTGPEITSISYPVDFPPEIIENYIYDNVYPETSDAFVLHAYFGEVRPNPEALNKIPKLLCENGCEGDNPVTRPWGPIEQTWGYVLPFNQWSCITGFDLYSEQMDIDYSYNGVLKMELPSTPRAIDSRYKNIETDFLGNAFPEKPIPGPFQDLKSGINEISLIPDNPWLLEYMKAKGIIPE